MQDGMLSVHYPRERRMLQLGGILRPFADNSKAQWPGAFGDPQTDQMAVPRESAVEIAPMQEVGRQVMA